MSESTREAKDPEILIQEVEAGLAFQELSRNDGGDDGGDDGDDGDEGEDDDGHNDGDAGDQGSNLLTSTDFLATGTVVGITVRRTELPRDRVPLVLGVTCSVTPSIGCLVCPQLPPDPKGGTSWDHPLHTPSSILI